MEIVVDIRHTDLKQYAALTDFELGDMVHINNLSVAMEWAIVYYLFWSFNVCLLLGRK